MERELKGMEEYIKAEIPGGIRWEMFITDRYLISKHRGLCHRSLINCSEIGNVILLGIDHEKKSIHSFTRLIYKVIPTTR